jgi:hypothetical protein
MEQGNWRGNQGIPLADPSCRLRAIVARPPLVYRPPAIETLDVVIFAAESFAVFSGDDPIAKLTSFEGPLRSKPVDQQGPK